jgi:hypothetical protein
MFATTQHSSSSIKLVIHALCGTALTSHCRRDMSTFVALGDIPRELSGPFRLRSLYDVVCFVRKLLSVAKANPILYDGSGQLQYITMQAMAATTSKLPGVGKVGGSSSSTSGRSRAAADPAKVKLREFLQRYYTGPHKSLAPSS